MVERDPVVVDAFKRRLAAEGKSRCQVCRWKPPVGLLALHDDPASMLHGHHVVPLACRGPDAESNLVLVCPTHHAIAHKLGRMERSNRWGLVWSGPQTPAQLLREIRLLEKDLVGWKAYVAEGRNYAALVQADVERAALARRAAFQVHTTTNSATREEARKNA